MRPPRRPHADAGPKGNQRIALCERCEFEIAGSGTRRDGVSWNLSVVGLYLVMHDEIPAVDAAVSVCLWLPGDPDPLRAETLVVWRNLPSPFKGCGADALRFPPGCGLKFVEIAAFDLARIGSRVETTYSTSTGPRR